jgi:hypothetical protein
MAAITVAMATVMAGVLRRVATALESVPVGPRKHEMPSGPPRGSGLPAMEVRRQDGSQTSLSELPGPFVLAVLDQVMASLQLPGTPFVIAVGPGGRRLRGLGAPHHGDRAEGSGDAVDAH